METVQITGNKREETRSSAAKKLRLQGRIPCVMYGGKKTRHFSVDKLDVRPLVYTPDFKIAEVTVEGESYRCLVREVQFDPVSDEIIHMDFLKLIEGAPLKVEVPLHFEGVPQGVRDGGRLVRSMRKVQIKTKPENLVDSLIIDVSEMTMGDSLRIKNVEVPEGVKIMNSDNIPVASVIAPRILKTAAEEEAELLEQEELLEGDEAEGEEGEEGAGEGTESESQES